jgi:hypothetical protein
MPFSINDMKSRLPLGGARPTLFEVTITPSTTLTGGTNIATIAPFMIQATTIPSSTIGQIEVPYFGRKFKVAGDRVFDSWSILVINDEDFTIRHAMESWHNKINSLKENKNTIGASPANYKQDATVTQYSKTGQKIREYKFIGMFPVEISAIDLDWNATDTIETFGVTFVYDHFEVTGLLRPPIR